MMGERLAHGTPFTYHYTEYTVYAATDMMGALVSSILADVGKESEKVLASEVMFSIGELGAEGRLFFLFDPSSTEKILAATTKVIGA